ncbi:MAG: ABC transporter permease [Patescibacteria group bacterium]
MKLHRIMALTMRHMYLFKRSVPRLMDIFFWPTISLLTWGFLTTYLEKVNLNTVNIASILLGAIIFWEFLQRFQNGVSITFLEEVWERNILNIFVTPITVGEFLSATTLLGIVRMVCVFAVMSSISLLLYHFSIFSVGMAFIPFMLILMLFGFSLGVFTMAVILRFGTQAQVLAFSIIFLFQPLSAVFYPVTALPHFLQFFAWLLPSTYVFEGMRGVLTNGSVDTALLIQGFIIASIYAALMVWFFYRMFAYVKRQGKLLKLE